jgi:hypothetical protein
MGWGTEFKAEIYLNKQIYKSESELENTIEEYKENISHVKEQLLMFASSNVKDISPSEWEEEPIRYVHYETSKLIEYLGDLFIELYELELYLKNYGTGKTDGV